MFDSLKRNVWADPARLTRLTRIYSDLMGIDEAQLRKHTRWPLRGSPVAHFQRWMLWMICRQITGSSTNQLARHFGYEDHTTILHGLRRLEGILGADPVKARDFDELLAACRNEMEAAA